MKSSILQKRAFRWCNAFSLTFFWGVLPPSESTFGIRKQTVDGDEREVCRHKSNLAVYCQGFMTNTYLSHHRPTPALPPHTEPNGVYRLTCVGREQVQLPVGEEGEGKREKKD